VSGVGTPPAEHEVQALARRLAAAGAGERTRVFHLGWLAERLVAQAMARPDFKTALFRFVDVFPACRDDRDVMRHVEEYFADVAGPRALDLGLGLAERVPFGAAFSAAAARRNVTRMARQLIAGADAAEALPRLARLWARGEAATVDLLGERTLTDADADRYAGRVAAMLEALVGATASWPARPVLDRDPHGAVPRANVSVKPTALAPLLGPRTREVGIAEATRRLLPLVRRARDAGATVHLDMEHDEAKDCTLDLLRALGAAYPDAHLGIVVQAYRTDSWDDLRALVAWAGATLRTPLQVRLVKGAYWDLENATAAAEGWPSPVFGTKDETDASFERAVLFLLDHAAALRPAIASHNLRSLAYAMAAARTRGLGDDAVELQLLYGMAEPVHAALRALGRRVRVYAPVGALVPGMAYLVRRLLENTSNESFIRHRFAEGQDLERLLAPPAADPAALPGPVDEAAARAATDPASPGPFANEPHAELRRARPRGALAAAVSAAPDAFGFRAPVLIDGTPVATADEIASVDPGAYATVVCLSGAAGPAEGERALAAARRALPAWSTAGPAARAAVLFRAAAAMRRARPALAALEVFEAGKPQAEADADVCEAIDFCEYYGRRALALGAGARVLQAPGETNRYEYVPRGIGAVVAPWNFPLAIPAGMIAAALVTGNCVLFKPAEQTPGVGARLVAILHEAGVPPGALAFLPGRGEEIGRYLVTHPDIAFVAFTGSREVGLEILARASEVPSGQRLVKHVVAEMGGKNAVIVDDDADLDEAVPAIVASAFAYAGQKCSAASRVIGVGAIFDALAERLVGAARIVPVGHPRALGTVVGPLIDDAAAARLARYRALAAAEGEILLARTDVPAGGWYAGPTITVPARPDARVLDEEIFGPLLALARADDLDHALALANAPAYGLTGGIFSRSPAHVTRATRELRAGNVYVNRGITGARVGRQPFGGIGLSGAGTKAGGPDYLHEFVTARTVAEHTMRHGFVPPAPE